MYRVATLALIAACGTSPDTRPITVEVVALEILAPTCGQVQCHSTSTNTEGYAFDTLDNAKAALRDLVNPNGKHSLLTVLESTGGDRMPPDYPLDSQDIDLIKAWIAKSAPGL